MHRLEHLIMVSIIKQTVEDDESDRNSLQGMTCKSVFSLSVYVKG